MTGDGGEYLRPEDLKELGDDSLPSSQFLDGMNYLRYSLEGGRVALMYHLPEHLFRHQFHSKGLERESRIPFLTPLGVNGLMCVSISEKVWPTRTKIFTI